MKRKKYKVILSQFLQSRFKNITLLIYCFMETLTNLYKTCEVIQITLTAKADFR